MDDTTASPCFMELPADLNHIISLGFSGDFKGFHYMLDLIFIVLAIACIISFDNKRIADIWKCDNMTKKESDWERNMRHQAG